MICSSHMCENLVRYLEWMEAACVGILSIRPVQNHLIHIQGATKTSSVSRYQETVFKSSNLCSQCGLVLPVATRMHKLSHDSEVAHTGVA